MSDHGIPGETLTVDPVAAEALSRGARIRARRLRMGIGDREFAELSGMSRTTLKKVENDDPSARETSYAIAENALDAKAEEMGHSQDDTGLVRYEVNIDGVTAIVVQGPVESIEEIEASVARIMKQLAAEGRD